MAIILQSGPSDKSYPHGDIRIGRGIDNDFVIDDESVSRCHALLTWSDGAWFIEDLGSANGTWLGPERIRSAKLALPAAVRIGDVPIRIAVHRSHALHWAAVILALAIGMASLVYLRDETGQPQPTRSEWGAQAMPPPAGMTYQRAQSAASQLFADADRSIPALAEARRAATWAVQLAAQPDEKTAAETMMLAIDAAVEARFESAAAQFVRSRRMEDEVGAQAAWRVLRELATSGHPLAPEVDRLARRFR
jgi:hypothetical protein